MKRSAKTNSKPKKLGQQASAEANRRAAVVLEVLAGVRTPTEAAAALKLSVNYYYVLERKAMEGLLAACGPAPKGPPGPSLAVQLQRLEHQLQQCRRECQRQAALVRATQRAVGLPSSKPAKKVDKTNGTAPKRRRRRRPTVRALRAAEQLRKNSSVENSSSAIEQSVSAEQSSRSNNQERQGGTGGKEATGGAAR